jgi:hypothetical protein
MPMMSMSASGDKADIPRSAPSCSRTCLGHRPTENERAPAEAGALLQILPTANANTAAPPATTRTPAPAWAPSPIATAPCTAAGASAGSANATSSFNGRRAVHERWQTAHSDRRCRIRLPGRRARQQDGYTSLSEKHFSGHHVLLG